MTDIAAIFHWPLSELEALTVDQLAGWQRRAVEWWNRHRASKG
ncbi:MAG: GpE family phage tail protein [Erythrobacter sp.]|nr:GpE family phage tail protein [Erythrobacter sp.]